VSEKTLTTPADWQWESFQTAPGEMAVSLEIPGLAKFNMTIEAMAAISATALKCSMAARGGIEGIHELNQQDAACFDAMVKATAMALAAGPPVETKIGETNNG